MTLDIPKRHSDPAPYISTSYIPPYARSAPDLRTVGYDSPLGSPARSSQYPPRSPVPSVSPARSLARGGHRARPAKYRRVSHCNGTPSSSGSTSSPRRGTFPNTSPCFRSRRASWWAEDEVDPWTEFRHRGYTVPVRPMSGLLPADSVDDPEALGCYRIRSFSVTSKGVVNLGDLLKQRSQSEVSVGSDASSSGGADLEVPSADAKRTPSTYRVMMLGAEGVGKSSIVAQFMTSDYLTENLCRQAAATSDEKKEKSVSLMVDAEESEVICDDPAHPSFTLDANAYLTTDAFVVVYSVTDRQTFQEAAHILETLRSLGGRQRYSVFPFGSSISPKVIIVVANKVDLARCRVVTVEEGRSLANKHGVKFIETSVSFNHNVDELLVGIVTQNRLKAQQTAALSVGRTLFGRPLRFTCKTRGLLGRLLQKVDMRTHSCDNLHVL